MALIINTTYGTTSARRFRITRKYTQIGSSSDSDLELKDEDLPQIACMIVVDEQRKVRIRCQASNCLQLDQRPLSHGETALWKVGKTLNIGGVVYLVLSDEDERKITEPEEEEQRLRAPERPVKISRNVRTFAVSETAMIPSGSRTTGSKPDSKRTAKVKTVAETPDQAVNPKETKKKKKSEKDPKKTTELSVIIICLAVAACIMIYSSSGPNGNGVDSDGASFTPEYVFSTLKEGAPYRETQLAENFQDCFFSEQIRPSTARRGYKILLNNMYVRYAQEGNKEVDAKPYQISTLYIQSRIDKLEQELDGEQ